MRYTSDSFKSIYLFTMDNLFCNVCNNLLFLKLHYYDNQVMNTKVCSNGCQMLSLEQGDILFDFNKDSGDESQGVLSYYQQYQHSMINKYTAQYKCVYHDCLTHTEPERKKAMIIRD